MLGRGCIPWVCCSRFTFMGRILFLSCDTVIIFGNFWTGNPASSWTLSFSRNTIVVKAVNRLGQTTEQIFNVQFIPPAPVITLGYAPETTSSPKITLTWTVFDENDDSPLVYVNDQLVRYANSMELSLNPGENVFKIVAGNSYGKTSELIYKVTYTP